LRCKGYGVKLLAMYVWFGVNFLLMVIYMNS